MSAENSQQKQPLIQSMAEMSLHAQATILPPSHRALVHNALFHPEKHPFASMTPEVVGGLQNVLSIDLYLARLAAHLGSGENGYLRDIRKRFVWFFDNITNKGTINPELGTDHIQSVLGMTFQSLLDSALNGNPLMTDQFTPAIFQADQDVKANVSEAKNADRILPSTPVILSLLAMAATRIMPNKIHVSYTWPDVESGLDTAVTLAGAVVGAGIGVAIRATKDYGTTEQAKTAAAIRALIGAPFGGAIAGLFAFYGDQMAGPVRHFETINPQSAPVYTALALLGLGGSGAGLLLQHKKLNKIFEREAEFVEGNPHLSALDFTVKHLQCLSNIRNNFPIESDDPAISLDEIADWDTSSRALRRYLRHSTQLTDFSQFGVSFGSLTQLSQQITIAEIFRQDKLQRDNNEPNLTHELPPVFDELASVWDYGRNETVAEHLFKIQTDTNGDNEPIPPSELAMLFPTILEVARSKVNLIPSKNTPKGNDGNLLSTSGIAPLFVDGLQSSQTWPKKINNSQVVGDYMTARLRNDMKSIGMDDESYDHVRLPHHYMIMNLVRHFNKLASPEPGELNGVIQSADIVSAIEEGGPHYANVVLADLQTVVSFYTNYIRSVDKLQNHPHLERCRVATEALTMVRRLQMCIVGAAMNNIQKGNEEDCSNYLDDPNKIQQLSQLHSEVRAINNDEITNHFDSLFDLKIPENIRTHDKDHPDRPIQYPVDLVKSLIMMRSEPFQRDKCIVMHQSLIEKMFSNIFGILKPPKEINGNVVDNYIRWSDDFLDVKVYSKLTEAQVRSLVGQMIILVEITAKGFNGGEQINTQSDPQRYIKATFVNKMIDAFFRNFGNRQMNAGVNIEQYQLLKNKFTYLSNKLKAHP